MLFLEGGGVLDGVVGDAAAVLGPFALSFRISSLMVPAQRTGND